MLQSRKESVILKYCTEENTQSFAGSIIVGKGDIHAGLRKAEEREALPKLLFLFHFPWSIIPWDMVRKLY